MFAAENYLPIAVIITNKKGVTVHGACLLLGLARGIKVARASFQDF